MGNMLKNISEIKGIDNSFYKNGGILVGFDESQQSKIGTYARVSCFKFGESQVYIEEEKYKFKNFMYEPMFGYIEDSYQKINAYTSAIEQFVNNLEEEFKTTTLKSDVAKIKEWFEKIFPIEVQDEWGKNMPTVGHVSDRIRTADELLCSTIRMKQIKEKCPDQEIIFLGDGISAFRAHIFPPAVFVKFFLRFLKEYHINYYAFSKICRLRSKNTGTLILPVVSEISYGSPYDCCPFIVEMPQTHSQSNSYLTRLIKRKMPALRFDVPRENNLAKSVEILKKIIPYSPTGYPLCLEHAHKASQLTGLEWRLLDVKYLGTQADPRTKNLVNNLRKFVLP